MSASRATRPWWLAAAGLAGCAVAPATEPVAPATVPPPAVVAAPGPAPATAAPPQPAAPQPAPAKPAVPTSFATPPLGLPSAPQAGDPTPADLRPPGWHCHWIRPGEKYCHGGMD